MRNNAIIPKNSKRHVQLIYWKHYIPAYRHAFPSIIKSITVEMFSTVETKGEAIEASI